MTETASRVPELSVVVASASSAQDRKGFLDALLPQCHGRNVEVIVAEGCPDGRSHEGFENASQATFIPLPGQPNLPMLWGEAIARSRGSIIAVTDTTCPVGDGWVAAVLAEHRASHPVIGGVVEMGTSRRWVDWTAYFCEYAQFMRPLSDGFAMEVPGNNVSFKRWALEKGSEFTTRGFWKTYWCQRLQSEGIRLVSASSILVSCNKSYRLVPFLVRRFHHGRCFAGMRFPRSAIARRAAYAAGSPLLPFVSLARIMRAVLPKRRYQRQFWLAFPLSVLAVISWSIGESCGYVAGTGESCTHIN